MNRDELEKWMQDQLGKEDFVPNEEGWLKVRAAIQPPAKNDSKKALVFLLPKPKRLGIAASVVFVILTGSLVYFTDKNAGNKISTDAITINQPSASPGTTEPATDSTGQQSSADAETRNIYHHVAADKRLSNTSAQRTDDPALYAQTPDITTYTDSPATRTLVSVPPKKEVVPMLDLYEPQVALEENNKALNFGLAAQFGKANVGNMRYQVGVVAHKEISEKFYAEATLAFASTEVSYTEKSSFQSLTVSMSSVSNIGTKSIDARYGSTILSAGIAPSFGYKITPKLAMGCGFAVYHNLEQSLSLQNKSEIESAVLSNHLVSETNPVSKWDAGLTGNAACKIGSKLTINLQYRHGLSTYLYFNNQAIRNSGFNMGLNYLFGK